MKSNIKNKHITHKQKFLGRGKILSMSVDYPWPLSNTTSKCIMKKKELAFQIFVDSKAFKFWNKAYLAMF